jgi:hypothetical protein
MFSVMHKSEVKKNILRTCILTLQGIKSIQCTATIKYIIWSYQSAIYSVYFLWSVLPPVVCRVADVLFTLFVFTVSGVQHISCLRLVVSNTYLAVFLFCLSSSCVPNVISLSGLSIFDFPFGILRRLLKNPFIILRYPITKCI